ncbi:3-hydroxybutyryl-CoA dehydrogenase [Desulfosporosinus sp.]|uniref:3-hydroxybutyryl-CoA dehydrogenase n=1 Tax=Desulfosporosinus sp. TaxID=157907 RepID=UPI0025BA3B67|nr:3-hydroxybutyryl-CoA dehydrogenase [Desulfosporosinus sp.]MBC2722402.1 3-hydroxybutyryl-CoA dehydrogenase [Desulfosporosinus sp.]MBC2726569.1 3-hydroxybutyryl-CoA dehydrogenase [Desulfosporosinus sp.]
MKKIAVLGAGTMGAGIALVAAQAGFQVILRDVSEAFVLKGLKIIDKILSKAVEKGKLSAEDKSGILGNLKGVYDANELAEELKDTDLIIEAIVENMSIKKSVYKEFDAQCPEKTIFASNTSALSISELAAATTRPQNVIGMHFFNPANIMQLVEVIAGAATSKETVETVNEFVKAIGKVPVQVKESPGFIVNRMLVPLINEAAFIYMEGIATPEDIDAAMKLGANHPIGPLALGDMIGLDVCLAVMETLYTEFGDPKYRPCPVLRKMVRAGFLGRKTEKGFYQY